MSKYKTKKHRGKYIILISSIIALNAMGITYAYWDNQLEIKTTLSTGNPNLIFCDENYRINIVRDGSENRESEISNLDISFDNERQTMIINGTLEDGYKAFIQYGVINDGTVPMKYAKNEVSSNQSAKLKMDDGVKVQVHQQAMVLEPQDKLSADNSNGNPKVEIQVPNQPKVKGKPEKGEQLKEDGQTQVELERYTFEIDLPFKQWTGDKSSWGYGDED